MNIKDVDRIPTVVDDRLEMIFERQTALHEKYKSIEVRNGVGHALIFARGFHIDDCRSQSYIKDMTWRVVEELAEASEAFKNGQDEHGKEEIADAFHFLVELCIVVGMTPTMLQPLTGTKGEADRLERLFNFREIRDPYYLDRTNLHLCMWAVTEQLGLVCNCLKNKPWKQTQMETDTKKMFYHLKEAFHCFIEASAFCGMGHEALFETYFKKSEVNQFRIRSNY